MLEHDALIAALVRAQCAAPALVATGRKDDRYDYATEGDYQAAMRPILLREGLALLTEEVVVGPAEEVPQKSGPALPSRRTVRLRVRIAHTSGRSIVVESAGTGTDTEGGHAAGDKAVSKALTAAWKALWGHLFWFQREGDLQAEVALRTRIDAHVPSGVAEAWMVLVKGWPALVDLLPEVDRHDDLVAAIERHAPEIRAWAAAATAAAAPKK